MATFAFTRGFYAAKSFGDRKKLRFVNTWAVGDDWTIKTSALLSGLFTLGKGNIAEQIFACALKLRNRMYIGIGSSFALSENGDVTGWEEQNPGAAVIPFLSQFGQQDNVKAFASQQGRLCVIGRFSTQIWSIDADPANFVLQQTLDNTGTQAMLSVKSIGDFDVLYLDDSGIRSLRAKESTLNSTVNDIGTPIDLTIRGALVGYDASLACAIVEPTTKQYWLFLNGTIYVLSNYPESKIVAWSTYKPQYQSTATITTGPNYIFPGQANFAVTIGASCYWVKGAGEGTMTNGSQVLSESGGFVATSTSAITTGTEGTPVTGVIYRTDNAFTPEKMIVSGGQIFIRGSDRKIYRYGGSDNNTFDHSKAVAELPWLDLKEPSMRKQLTGIDVAITGHWRIETSANPRAPAYVTAIDRGSQTAPNMVDDSSFDIGRFGVSGNGTHIKIKATSWTDDAAKLGKLSIIYKPSGEK